MNIDELQTGDILLISNKEKGIFDYFLDMIRYGTHSDYVHIGIVLKDPDFLEKKLEGLFIWESGFEGTPDPQDNKIKLGVQVTEFNDFLSNYKDTNVKIFVRKFNHYNLFKSDKLKEIHQIAYNRPYDINPRDWIGALFNNDSHPQKTDRFWCSAFVGFVLTKLDILKSDTDWSIMKPCDFALDGENLSYVDLDKAALLDIEFKLNLT